MSLEDTDLPQTYGWKGPVDFIEEGQKIKAAGCPAGPETIHCDVRVLRPLPASKTRLNELAYEAAGVDGMFFTG